MKKLKVVNIKEFGATKLIIPLKATSKVNEKGELIKLKQYNSDVSPNELADMSQRNLYEGDFDLEDRKRKRKQPKTKRHKSKKR